MRTISTLRRLGKLLNARDKDGSDSATHGRQTPPFPVVFKSLRRALVKNFPMHCVFLSKRMPYLWSLVFTAAAIRVNGKDAFDYVSKGRLTHSRFCFIFPFMARRHTRIFMELDKENLLKALGECRRACKDARAKAPIGDPVYQGTEAVNAADDLAERLAGDREAIWLKPHSWPRGNS